MLNETFSVIFKPRGVGWGRYWNVNGDVALVHFGQPNIRPEAEMWLPTCTRAKFVCSGDYFHFLPRRIFSLSMRLLGFQVQLRLSTSRTSPEKWPWTDTSRKTTQWTTAWQKSVYITLSQKAIFRHKNRENLSKTIIRVTRVTFIGRPGWLTLYRSGWF